MEVEITFYYLCRLRKQNSILFHGKKCQRINITTLIQVTTKNKSRKKEKKKLYHKHQYGSRAFPKEYQKNAKHATTISSTPQLED
jgi:hypothetical protein